MLRKIYVAICATLFIVSNMSAQQVSPRIAGLEKNAEYMSLLQEDAHLRIREDSMITAVEKVRLQFRDEVENRPIHAKKIITLEEQIFAIRTAKGRLIDKINTIEQNWVLKNLDAPQRPLSETVTEGEISNIPDSLKVRNLVYNSYFKENLSAKDYEALLRAQKQELAAVDYVNRYFANQGDIAKVAAQYAATETEAEAGAIYGKYQTMQGLNKVLSDSLAQTWTYIFDNKSYVYGYLLDKCGEDTILAREEERLSEVAQQLSVARGKYASDVVTDYFLRKAVVVDYETALAEMLRLDAARDSLKGVMTQLQAVDFKLPRIDVAERYFLDYEPLSFSLSQYSSRHPIPECKVYQNGTIYRILLGSYQTKRAVATFKGVVPLGYLVNEENRWSYYAGGFRTKAEAEEAQQQLLKKGFQRPEIVMWTDGAQRNLSSESANVVSYRVEIAGVSALSDEVKAAITTTAEGLELSRVGQQLFVVGLFTDKAVADKVVEAIKQADGSLEIKVAEITE
ncbi:MAG: SPOR domain-containing protein [Alistipes sp.]